MSFATLVVGAYGCFSLAGGIIGYVKAKSTPSLIAGSLSGVILLWSAYGINEGNRGAYLVGLIIALLLGLRFLKTWLKNRRLMPDLLMVSFSLLTLIVAGIAMVQA